jgi:four helix bundle protein
MRTASQILLTRSPIPIRESHCRELLRSAWSVASNYRVTKHARSNADFVSKMSIVAEEGEESAMWLEALQDLSLLAPGVAEPLHCEALELTAIAAASVKTARRNAR